ncbi:MAG: geranylgeranyl reductase family protein [Candidatus Methanomethylophilaceae archaeon]
MNPEVAVVGAGPAGCMAASLLAPKYRVTVLEEHAVSGEPVQCTGLVSDRVLRLAGTDCPVLNSIHGARVHFPGGGVLSVRSPERKATVIDRSLFDSLLAEKALDAGAEIEYSAQYLSHSLKPDALSLCYRQSGIQEMEARLLVGADGQNSRIGRSMGGNPPREWVRGLQVDLDIESSEKDMVDIFVGSQVAPGFFAWSLPGGDFTRVGLCVSWEHGPPNVYLNHLLESLRFTDAKVLRRHNGRIPLGGRPRSYGERLLLLGDAAGQVKPVSGGGLQPGLSAARCLAQTASQALEADRLDSGYLSAYERRWKKTVGRELSQGYRLRRIYVRMSDGKLDEAFQLLDRDDVSALLQKGDIDHPSSLAPKMLRHLPSLLRFSPLLLGSLFQR